MAMKSFAQIAEELKMHPEAVRRHSEHMKLRNVRVTPWEMKLLKDYRSEHRTTYEDHTRTIK